MQTTIVKASTLTAGDRITEVDTPAGPFYVVLEVTARSIVVDASDDDEPLPVTLPATGAVRRAA